MALNTELIGKDDGNTVMEKLVPFNSFEKFADFCALNPTSLSDFVKCVFNMHKFSIYHHDINMKNICVRQNTTNRFWRGRILRLQQSRVSRQYVL